jgi:hypothetical protein
MCKALDDDLAWLADRANLNEPFCRAVWISAAKEIFERYKTPAITNARISLASIDSRLDTIEKILRRDPSTWRF